MSSLIIKSKIWNNLTNQSINYKEKNFRKQKLTLEYSAKIYRQKEKIFVKKLDESTYTSNSNENTNYMNDKKDELLTILKQGDNKYVVNCGNWSKDLTKLIDEDAAYILYKGLTIENLLKEKQKYYVLSQGDIIKLGKIYLKLLHINLSNLDKDDDEEEEEKKEDVNTNLNNINSIKEEQIEEDKGGNEEEEVEEDIKDNIEAESYREKEQSNILLTYTKNDLNQRKNNKNANNNNVKNNSNNNFINYSFSYIPKNFKNIDLYFKQYIKGNKKDRLNKSFDGKISASIQNNIMKESININHSKSPKLSQIKPLSILNKFKSNNLINSTKQKQKKITNIKTRLIKKSKLKVKRNKKDLNDKQKQSLNNSETNQPIGKICRICLSGEDNPINNPLMCPCICKGSMKYIHYLCLKNWLNLKVESELGHRRNLLLDQPTITYSTNDISCELCKARLPDYIRHNGKIFNVLFYKPKYDKFLVLESIRDDDRRTKFIHIIPLIKRSMIKIGRLNTCDLSLPDLSISRVHCYLYIEGGQIFLENNSKYGTKILVQNNNLVMSSSFPLCLEIQNTYLKLILKKNFSLFGCCGVNTTTISKMLVYQEQNEKGFDIFCSMVIKEDNDIEDVKEEQKEENTEQNNIINSINNLNQENETSNENRIEEEMIRNEIMERLKNYNEGDTDNKIKNNIKLEGKKIEQEEENKSNNEIKIINEIRKELNKNELNMEGGIINLNNSLKEKSRDEIFTKIEDEREVIKSIKIIKDERNKNKGNYINRTFENYEYNLINNESEKISRTNIYNDMNRTVQKIEQSNLNDKILANLKKGKYNNNEIKKDLNKELQNEIKKEKEEIKDIDLLEDKQNKNIQIAINETQRTKIKKEENKIIPILNKNKKNEINIENQKEIEFEENNKEILKQEENKNEIKEESKEKENELIKKISEEIKKPKIDERHNMELSQKKILNKKFKEIDRNNSINMKETRYDKTMSEQKDEHSQTTIKYEKKENSEIQQIPEENIKKNLRYDNEEKKINNKEMKKIRKSVQQSIDLNAINELSYGQIQNSCNIDYTPIDSYHSIFGLRQINKNEGSNLLAPKHKNIKIKKLELNTNNEKNNNFNKSNASWNKYTYQYEEDKKNKNLK